MKRSTLIGFVSLGMALAIAPLTLPRPVAARHASAPAQPALESRANQAIALSSTGLAQHLRRTGAKMYGTYWCGHCAEQKALFGAAFRFINYIECAEDGPNARPDLCRRAKIEGYPTWEIGGRKYPGTQSLAELARLSGYRGQ